MSAPFQPQFLAVDDSPLNRRLVIHHPPTSGPAKGLVVYAHPFAEEMNKSRRMAAAQARNLAASGLAVLQIDLMGCGDSVGDFGDATWERWIEDVVAAADWLRQEHATTEGGRPLPMWLWGLRSGCLLAVEAAARLAESGAECDFLFWQPAPSGKLLLQQFLRLKAASELLAGQAKAAMDQLRCEIAAGRPVEVAGYRLSAALCAGLEQATLRPRTGVRPGRMIWLEVSPVEQPTLAPAGASTMAAWREAGWSVQSLALRGPAFWHTTEIEDAPALIEATCDALLAAARGAAAPAEVTPT